MQDMLPLADKQHAAIADELLLEMDKEENTDA
jgi:hypothetical protein